ncbi:MAG: GNAT family N-acetyltransferase [Synergistaceae bacterium]|jgi:ribosomal-protein-alanine N-acetyltransferase|nr:GNAT family N-acetyltransferase [Synergistaceae bacterium]
MILTDIRFCTTEDIDQILQIDRTSPWPWPEKVIQQDLSDRSGEVTYLGAFSSLGDRLLGYAVLGEEKGEGLLMNLVVIPEYRRQSIGQQLVFAVGECAESLGFTRLSLRVRYSNHGALKLYRGLGFKNDARRESFYSDGDMAYFMSRSLPVSLQEDRRP